VPQRRAKSTHPSKNPEIFPAAPRNVNLFYPGTRNAQRFALDLHLMHNTLALPFMTAFSPFSTVAEIAASVRSRQISPVELVESHLRRIESLQPKLNAFVHLDG